MIVVYGENALSYATVKCFAVEFHRGITSLEDDASLGVYKTVIHCSWAGRIESKMLANQIEIFLLNHPPLFLIMSTCPCFSVVKVLTLNASSHIAY